MAQRRWSTSVAVGLGVAAALAATRLYRKTYNLAGKTVFINGGSRGLGLLLAREFARRGAKVAISARDREALDRADTDLRGFGSEVLAIEADTTIREEAEAAIEKVRQKFGPIDVLVIMRGQFASGRWR